MPKVFISYRRADPLPNWQAKPIGRMCRDHGFDEVFLDRDKGAIPFGSNYRQEIEKAIRASDVTLVLIGEQWQAILDEKRHDPNDMVQIEIGLSLELGKVVVPILLGGRMPAVNDLPERLQPFHFCNGGSFGPDDIEERMPALMREVVAGLERRQAEKEARRREEQRLAGEATRKQEEQRLAKEEAVWRREQQRLAEEAARKQEEARRNVPPIPAVATPAPTIQNAPSGSGLPREQVVDLGRGVKMAFCFIPAGTFLMGEGGDAHQVTLTKDFWLGKYPVTQEQWQAVMGSNPSIFKGPQHPVEKVSWNDAQEFLKKLGSGYRLPTEAEWEYACRAGSTTAYCFGDDEGRLGEFAWFEKNSGKTTHPVGEKKPNAWGLRDCHGNVWEWCQDWFGDYPKGAVTDPTGPPSGRLRVRRGGCWDFGARGCRSASRSDWPPDYRDYLLGFRVAAGSIPSSPGSR